MTEQEKEKIMEDMRNRIMRNRMNFKIFCVLGEKIFGACGSKNVWSSCSWDLDGEEECCDSEYDLIQKDMEWHEDYYVCRESIGRDIFHSSMKSLEKELETGGLIYPIKWIERRHYRRVNGRDEFLKAERLGFIDD